jgi:hypothetical protein
MLFQGKADKVTFRLFACTLKEHQRLRPSATSGKKKSASSRQMPSWQVDISQAVREMEAYSHDKLAAEGGEDEDENAGAVAQDDEDDG